MSEVSIHVNFDELYGEIGKLEDVDKDLRNSLLSLVNSLKDITQILDAVLKKDSHEDEKQLWQEYTQLQREKLLVLDLSHEYNQLEIKVRNFNPNLNTLIKGAIEEVSDHIAVGVETHRAHIDILEIRNARNLGLNALVITAILAYIAVWEYSVREFIVTLEFPLGLSPVLNYVLVLVTLSPIIITVVWALLNRRTKF